MVAFATLKADGMINDENYSIVLDLVHRKIQGSL
jgi:hypothetical protein